MWNQLTDTKMETGRSEMAEENRKQPLDNDGDNPLCEALRVEYSRFENILKEIAVERISNPGYYALAGAMILNIACVIFNPQAYMIIWILASLYFYLTYPLLPLILFAGQMARESGKKSAGENVREPMLPMLKNLHLFKNRNIVIRLAIRFFIMGIMPLTSGMALIYSISLIFAVILGIHGIIPPNTSLLIIIQCLGILILYLDLTYLKKQCTFVVRKLNLSSEKNIIRYLIITILGIIIVGVASVAAIILLIAILLPGFTLGVYDDVTALTAYRTDAWIGILLISQFIWMQCLQSVLSRRITRIFGMDLAGRIRRAEILLACPYLLRDQRQIPPGKKTRTDDVYREVLSLLYESRIHAISRTRLAGLFPTYSIGINIKELLRIEGLHHLSAMFKNPRP